MEKDVPRGLVSQAQHDRLIRKYNTLHHSYRDLETRYIERKADLEKLSGELDKAKREVATAQERIHQWNLWIRTHPDGIRSSKTPCAEQVKRGHAAEGTTNQDQHISSSQTTESESNELPLLPEIPSSDGPEIVSTRQVKRRRMDSPRQLPSKVKQEPNSPQNPIELASEDFSSPVPQCKPPLRAETSDLNALLPNVRTPRKRRRGRRLSEDVARPLTFGETKSFLSEGDERGVDVHNMDYVQVDLDTSAVTAPTLLLDNGSSGRGVLGQLSSNIQSPLRNSINKITTSHKRKLDEVAMLSEDGDMASSQAIPGQQTSTPNAVADRRLDALLSGPTPGRAPLAKRRTPDTVIRRTEKEPTIKAEPLDDPTLPQIQAHKRWDRPQRRDPTPPPPDPEEEPLRSRPLASLQLSDFKVNPRYLNSTFAFADTLRGRDARRCLQGCTKPDCCGAAFRKAVEFGMLHPDKTDSQLLEENYGPAYQQVMCGIPKEKQQDLLLQARANAFANAHGKHRQAFDRAKSPPGFWRTDMPTTQEEEEDRSRATEMERAKVEVRWREALRPGGRWVFRDEE